MKQKYLWRIKGQICKSCNRPIGYKPIDCSEPEHQIYYDKKVTYQLNWQKINFKPNAMYRSRRNDYNKKNKNKKRLWGKKSSLKWLYGLSIEQIDGMLLKQNYSCTICQKPFEKRDFKSGHAALDLKYSVDHDHNTGRVRGLLCQKCNIGIAWVEAVGATVLFGNINNYLGMIQYEYT